MSRKIGDKDVWVRNFDVSQPTKHKKGFTVYKVVSTVFPKGFPDGATKITVWKRYNDFKKLHKELEMVFKHLYLKGEFPKLPKERLFGRFDEEIIEERRKASLALLKFAASYPQLFTNKVFVKFFEASYDSQDLETSLSNPKEKNASQFLNQPEESSKNGVTVEEDLLNCECLVPEKLWTEDREKLPREDGVSHSDANSLSSFTSSSPEHIPFNNRHTVHPAPQAKESSQSDTLPNSNHSSSKSIRTETVCQPPKIQTFSDSNASRLIPGCSNEDSQINASCSPYPTPYTLQENTRARPSLLPSASLSEDLDTISDYFEGQFGEAAASNEVTASSSQNSLPFNLPSSISCLSLDTLTTRKAFNPSSSSKNQNSNGTPGKKLLPNGFGLFDFLPIFAKEKKEVTSPSLAESLSTPYICEAAGHFTVAHNYESNGELQSALDAYKEGIQVLLDGAKGDTDSKRKLLVRKKLEKYMNQAEDLKKQIRVERARDVYCAGNAASFYSPGRRLQNSISRTAICKEEGFVVVDSNVLPSSIEELKKYKVVGSTFHNLLVVVDTTYDGGPKCYAIKVLRKSALPLDPEKPTLIPSTVPFMVELVKWCNTEDAIILVLQYAGGGRLINFVESYQTKQIFSHAEADPAVNDDENPQSVSADKMLTSEDALSRRSQEGKPKVLEDEEEISKVKSDKVCNKPGEEIKGSILLNNDTACSSADVVKEILCEETAQVVEDIKAKPNPYISSAVPPPSLILDEETNQLLENSRVLLQTVSRALEEQKKSLLSNKENERKSQIETDAHKNTTSTGASESLRQCDASIPSLFPIKSTSTFELVPDNEVEGIFKRMVPISCIKVWTAELVLALEKLHTQGITFGDMDINNILLGENGHILLTYRALWNEVDTSLQWNDFCAPEVRSSWGKSLWKIHPSADWWSLGAILFLLITGQTLEDLHPEGIHPQTAINVPSTNICGETIGNVPKSLLIELLQFNPATRLGYYGAEEIKSHPFFEGFDWDNLVNSLVPE